jgi:hypothetical protein
MTEILEPWQAVESLSVKSCLLVPSDLLSLKAIPKIVKTMKRLIPKLIKLENLNADNSLGNETGKSSKKQ